MSQTDEASKAGGDYPLTVPIPFAGKQLGIGEVRAYQSAREGEIPTLSFGHAKRVPVAALAEMLGVSPETIGRASWPGRPVRRTRYDHGGAALHLAVRLWPPAVPTHALPVEVDGAGVPPLPGRGVRLREGDLGEGSR